MANRQYIGARYVPQFFKNPNGGSEWLSGVAYEALTIVTYANNSYTSKIPVPATVGAPNANATYWVQTGVYNEQIESYRKEVEALAAEVDADKAILDSAVADIESINNRYINDRNKKLLIIGDSYAVPVTDGHTDVQKSYADLLLEKYAGMKLCGNGWGFVSVFNQATFLQYLKNATIPDKDTYTDILICGGVNDAGSADTKVISQDAIKAAIIEMVDYCHANFVNAKVHIGLIGAITTTANLQERAINLYHTVLPAYKNANAKYDFMTFSESVLYDRSLIYSVHPTQEGQNFIYNYLLHYLNGTPSVQRSFGTVITPIGENGLAFNMVGDVTDGRVKLKGVRAQYSLGRYNIGPFFNIGSGVKIADIPANSPLACPSRPGYMAWMILGSIYVARHSAPTLNYAGVGFMYPSEDGKSLKIQCTSPDNVFSSSAQADCSLYFFPQPCELPQY